MSAFGRIGRCTRSFAGTLNLKSKQNLTKLIYRTRLIFIGYAILKENIHELCHLDAGTHVGFLLHKASGNQRLTEVVL